MNSKVTYLLDEQAISARFPNFKLSNKMACLDTIRFIFATFSDKYAESAKFNGFDSSGKLFGRGFVIDAEHPELLPDVYPLDAKFIKREIPVIPPSAMGPSEEHSLFIPRDPK